MKNVRFLVFGFVSALAGCGGVEPNQLRTPVEHIAVPALAGCSISCECKNPDNLTVSCNASGANATCSTTKGPNDICIGVTCTDADGTVTTPCMKDKEAEEIESP